MPFEMRWFQIIYTTFGTAMVGRVFGGIASLKADLQDLTRFYAWRRREVSKRLIEDMKGTDDDNKIDQYEFMVGSLLMLKKIDKSDVDQIMDKFRQLAGSKGYIMSSDAEAEGVKAEIHAEEAEGKGEDTEGETEEYMMLEMDHEEVQA